MLKITGNMTHRQLAVALDAALLYGFMSESAVFPVASADGDTTLPQSYEQLFEQMHNVFCGKSDQKPLPFVSDSLYNLDFRRKKALKTCSATECF